eukprot:CAMPEP_0206453130 /NCGR_PEP_ID=MMETSP0324_2-20121206/20355_1 /ASSEMBLY_ACC=CAM_ASM_000836 /TAXON_ID=2866 /ORGANISM="Crypthecodinium cohnii, Strain Seligo" /LENGTH=91 /DNA_ID=CAMNT_0053923347 /DNA_START=107 /DNA_END=379 /DNA_ORIENTATION=+
MRTKKSGRAKEEKELRRKKKKKKQKKKKKSTNKRFEARQRISPETVRKQPLSMARSTMSAMKKAATTSRHVPALLAFYDSAKGAVLFEADR